MKVSTRGPPRVEPEPPEPEPYAALDAPHTPIKTKKRVFEIKAKAARSRPLGLPRSPRTEWEVSRRPPAKMRQSG